MLNQVVLVGRSTNDLKIEELNNKKIAVVTLAVPRTFKNCNGIYDTDYIDCELYDNVALNTSNYVKKGDIVGIKARIETKTDINDNKEIKIIAEKLTFLSSKKEDK